MSLMALILIIGAPALVSVIDDDIAYDGARIYDYDDSTVFSGSIAGRTIGDTNGENPLASVTTSIFTPTESGTGYIFNLDHTNLPLWYIRAACDLKDLIEDGVRIITVTAPDVVHLTYVADKSYRFVETAENIYTLNISSVDAVSILSFTGNEVLTFGFSDNVLPTSLPATGIFEFDLEMKEYYSIAYGELIVGATGVLLIVCAILATPWVGTTGLTIKRRR
jgi:hypothetical protein